MRGNLSLVKRTAPGHLRSLAPHAGGELERLVRARQWIGAIRYLRELDPTLGLVDAQSVVFTEQQRLGVSTDPPLESLEVLGARVESLLPRPVAIEAVWDGDTVRDWFVQLLAIVPDRASPRGYAERGLACITWSHGCPSERATEIGDAVAARLGVPFFFASPTEPNDRAARWWDSG
jgi:hypothetical protein